jgi:hypothetical protein
LSDLPKASLTLFTEIRSCKKTNNILLLKNSMTGFKLSSLNISHERVYTASQGKDQNWFNQVRLKEKIVTVKLIGAWSQHIQILWRNRDLDHLFQSLTLTQCNQYLQQNPIPDKNQKNYSDETSRDLFESFCHLLRIACSHCLNRSLCRLLLISLPRDTSTVKVERKVQIKIESESVSNFKFS